MKLHKKKSLRKFSLWLIGTFIALAALTRPAYAVSTLGIDIKVSINATKALTVAPTYYDFGALTVNTSSVSASSLLVSNTSGSLLETYTLQGANANSTGGGTNWTLASSTGPIDQYMLGAQFSTGSPANTDSTWVTSISSTSVGTCSSTQFGNGTPAEAGSGVSPIIGSHTRDLWFRMTTPAFVTDSTQRQATVTLAVQ